MSIIETFREFIDYYYLEFILSFFLISFTWNFYFWRKTKTVYMGGSIKFDESPMLYMVSWVLWILMYIAAFIFLLLRIFNIL